MRNSYSFEISSIDLGQILLNFIILSNFTIVYKD